MTTNDIVATQTDGSQEVIEIMTEMREMFMDRIKALEVAVRAEQVQRLTVEIENEMLREKVEVQRIMAALHESVIHGEAVQL